MPGTVHGVFGIAPMHNVGNKIIKRPWHDIFCTGHLVVNIQNEQRTQYPTPTITIFLSEHDLIAPSAKIDIG